MMTPARIAETGFVVVDATWGTIRPSTLAKGVVTVAELEESAAERLFEVNP